MKDTNVNYLEKAFQAMMKYKEQLSSDKYLPDDSDLDLLDDISDLTINSTKQVEEKLK